jgi:oligopeptide transport system permease protein
MDYEKITQGYEPVSAEPTESDSTGSGLGIPSFPPSAANIKDLGPASDTPTELISPEAIEGGSGAPASPFRMSLRRFARDKRAMISLGIVIFFILVSFIFPYIYQHLGPTIQGGAIGNTPIAPQLYHEYTHQELLHVDEAPSGIVHPMGTDALGRDIFARLMAGVNVSIVVALIVVSFDITLGVIVGTLAGFYGGAIDTFLARFTDLVFAFPSLLFAILAAATLGQAFTDRLGPSGRLILVSLALAITIWPQMARYVRGQTLQLKEQQFIEAARTVGSSNSQIILRHIVPNLFSIVLTAATLDIVGIIIGEATVSLLGLGVQTPGSSLGLMIFNGTSSLTFRPTEVLFPTITLAILVLCFSFVGDGIGAAFNPRTKD